MAGKISVAQIMEILRAETRGANEPRELDVWVCGCCARTLNTGDDSGCRDFHGHTHPTCDKNIVRADIEHTFEVGYFHANCNGCGEIVRTGGTLYAAIRLTDN